MLFGPFCQVDALPEFPGVYQEEWSMGAQGKGSLNTFGGFALSFEGLCLRDDENRSKKVWGLLSYLILNRRRDLGVAELYQMLWQDKDEENPYGALKTLIFRTRRLLEEAGFPSASMVLSSKGIYRWNPEWTMKVDAEEFERLSELCLREDFDMEAGKEQWKEAISLYKGEFLPGVGEFAWVMEKGERYRSLYKKLVRKACLWLLETRQYKEAEETADTGLRLYEYQEEFEGCKILALYYMGQVEEALKRYLMVMEKFYKERQITPSDKFKELYHLVSASHLEEPKPFDDITAELSEPENTKDKAEENHYGAYECEYSVFKRLFWLERRAVSRSGESVYLCLLSIERPKGGKMKPDVLSRAAERLKMVIQSSLRASDIFSRYSVSQYVVLIPAATYENCEAVMARITQAFNKGYVRRDVAAVSQVTAVLPADQDFGN